MSFTTGFNEGMKQFGMHISAVVNAVLLFVAYFIGVGTTAISAKIVRKHFLERKMHEKSYWSDLDLKKESMERYVKQF